MVARTVAMAAVVAAAIDIAPNRTNAWDVARRVSVTPIRCTSVQADRDAGIFPSSDGGGQGWGLADRSLKNIKNCSCPRFLHKGYRPISYKCWRAALQR